MMLLDIRENVSNASHQRNQIKREKRKMELPKMKFDSLIILTIMNCGFYSLSTNATDKWFFLIMAVVWLVLALANFSKERMK